MLDVKSYEGDKIGDVENLFSLFLHVLLFSFLVWFLQLVLGYLLKSC